MSYYRTPEHRALRTALLRRWKPWEQSTGPKTPDGKAGSAMRGYKGGARELIRQLSQVLHQQTKVMQGHPTQVIPTASRSTLAGSLPAGSTPSDSDAQPSDIRFVMATLRELPLGPGMKVLHRLLYGLNFDR